MRKEKLIGGKAVSIRIEYSVVSETEMGRKKRNASGITEKLIPSDVEYINNMEYMCISAVLY